MPAALSHVLFAIAGIWIFHLTAKLPPSALPGWCLGWIVLFLLHLWVDSAGHARNPVKSICSVPSSLFSPIAMPAKVAKHSKPKSKPSKSKLSKSLKHERKDPVFLAPVVNILDSALCALRNNEMKITKEVKAPTLGGLISGTSCTTIEYPKELVAAFRGMFGALKEYRFEMHFVSALSTSAGGSLLTAIPLSPSVSSYAEWTALSALFDEVKMIGSKITCNSVNSVDGATEMPMAIASDHVNLSTNPASTLAVIRLAQSTTFNTTSCVKPYVKTVKFADSERLWCITGTPYSQSPLGGCVGTWSLGNLSVGSVSVPYLSCIVRSFIKLRCRA
jgi:hypothetical protein